VPGLARVGEYELARFAHHVEKSVGVKPRITSEKEPWEEGFQIEHGYSFAEVARARSRYFLKTVTTHPVATIRLLATSTTLLLGVPDSRLPLILMSPAPAYEGGSIMGRLVWLRQLGVLGLLLALGMVIALGGALAVPVLALRARTWPADKRWLLVLLVAATFFHMVMSSTVIWTAERYRVPVMPLLCVMFSVAVFGERREEEGARSRSDRGQAPRPPVPSGPGASERPPVGSGAYCLFMSSPFSSLAIIRVTLSLFGWSGARVSEVRAYFSAVL
jgi:hypothetical protein